MRIAGSRASMQRVRIRPERNPTRFRKHLPHIGAFGANPTRYQYATTSTPAATAHAATTNQPATATATAKRIPNTRPTDSDTNGYTTTRIANTDIGIAHTNIDTHEHEPFVQRHELNIHNRPLGGVFESFYDGRNRNRHLIPNLSPPCFYPRRSDS